MGPLGLYSIFATGAGKSFQKQLIKENGYYLKMAVFPPFKVGSGFLWGELTEKICKEA